VNVVRFIPQIGPFTYAQRDAVGLRQPLRRQPGHAQTPAGAVTLIQTTDYPWNGKCVSR
jgi:hypothetical protein